MTDFRKKKKKNRTDFENKTSVLILDPLSSPAHVLVLVRTTEQGRQKSHFLTSLALMFWDAISFLP